MSGLDSEDPEVIDFAAAGPRGSAARQVRGRLLIAGVVAAVIAVAAAVVLAGIRPGSAPAAGHGDPALARLVAQVTGVPVRVSDAAGAGTGGLLLSKPVPVTGPPLTARGKPEVLYIGSEYCPYCATQTWAMIVALSRFGTFTGLRTIRSASYQSYPPLDTWTFYGSAFTSRYLTFVPVETRSNVKTAGGGYARLQRLTAAQQALLSRYGYQNSVPFLDFGNRFVMNGSSFAPFVLERQTWSQVAAELGRPRSPVGATILGDANYITAALCRLTGGQPARACTPVVGSLPGPWAPMTAR